jgi:hypothetical protein
MFRLPKIRFGAVHSISDCPSCNGSSIYRSRRYGRFEMILGRILLLYPYRCQQCDARFYIFGQRRLSTAPVKPEPSGSPQLS